MDLYRLTAAVLVIGLLAACAPEAGSQKWCEIMKEKPKGEWSMNETGEFARHCLFE